MALFTTDFSEYESGLQPSGWTKRFTTASVNYTVEDSDWGVAPGKRLFCESTAAATRKMLSWDALDGTQDFDALFLIKIADLTSNYYGWDFGYRGSGTAASPTQYNLNVISSGPDFRFGRIVAGSGITGPGGVIYGPGARNNLYHWMRVRCVGSAHKYKIWRFDHVEPNDWNLEETDANIAAGGWIGPGFRGATSYSIYWLGIDTGAVTVPIPSTVWNQDIYWGVPEIDILAFTSSSFLNSCMIQGGMFNESGRELQAISVRVGTHTQQARLALFTGGVANDPATAELLVDLGQTSGGDSGILTVTLAEPVEIPAGFIWIAIKSNSPSQLSMYYYNAGHPGSYNSQKARGASNTSSLDENPAVAFPDTYGYTGSFSNSWRSLRLTLVQRSLFPPPPEEVRQNREDISGNDRHLLDTGTKATGNSIGKIGNACYFSGEEEELLTLASAPDIYTADPSWTIAFRIKPHADSAPGSEKAWQWDIGAEFSIKVGFKTGEVLAFVECNCPSLSVSTLNIIVQDVYSLITIYFDGSNLKIDVDNSNIASDAGASIGLTSAPASMSMGFAAAQAMTLSVDEVGIWLGANALDAAQRTTLYSGNYGQRPTFA